MNKNQVLRIKGVAEEIMIQLEQLRDELGKDLYVDPELADSVITVEDMADNLLDLCDERTS